MKNKYDELVKSINNNKKIQKEELDNKLLIKNKVNDDEKVDEFFDELSVSKSENFEEDEKNIDIIDDYIKIEDNFQTEMSNMESENVGSVIPNPSLYELNFKSKEKEVSKKDYKKVRFKKIDSEKKYYKGEEAEYPRDETISNEQKQQNDVKTQKNDDSRKPNSKEVIRREANDSQREINTYNNSIVNIIEEENEKKPPESYIKLINLITNEISSLENLFNNFGQRKKKKRKKKYKKEGEYNKKIQK